MKLIAGLGNPGKKYERTRHNVGFMVVDELSFRHQTPWKKAKFNGMVSEINVNGEKMLLVKPLTFMNASGECIRPLMDYYNIPMKDVLIIYDDLDLPVGKIRLRQKGSAGGHNGMKSIIQHVKTQEFNRIRVGVSRPSHGEVINYVLGDFPKSEQADIIEAIQKSADAVEDFAKLPFIEVMNKYN
ncbi:aminoacyl-tRNA hydrolase [Listeria ivanovii]|uniref:Peptidyl-tRNA hydrolase n=1 Tax=Listeria ivanovii TaxID=1638 RepID=A0AAX2DT64_LISIV|nr:aminoacyl-tRNA hydrolase [Listeria ivanovii]EFR98365.1 peptidyl-tRNA hydrolase [Listeria ivanovii FSL F6-596]AIS61483.1 peptidyl-tRNA hydrolase [Listeria ivanovii subsp. londoniensis]MBC2256615.1 aminoacyl-tRNA hydrolase [Listeria ivanovii]MBK1967451.1 aminoacyl-tRNA hydrolase [Listeria ivanovii subsp. londoniensis]MBK1985460.1 aminoacyl-tRNA hydrolase [Listeria ivanovii subsp. londoniensis]